MKILITTVKNPMTNVTASDIIQSGDGLKMFHDAMKYIRRFCK